MYSKSNKNGWALFLFLLAGIVLGGFAGYYAEGLPYCSWLNYGQPFGLSSPLELELGIIRLVFGLTIKINIAGILGMIIGIIVYRKM